MMTLENAMRGFVLLGCAALLLGGCGENRNAAENTAGVDQNLSVEAAPAGDTTAIDATAGEDANMAAEADVTLNESATPAAENESANSR